MSNVYIVVNEHNCDHNSLCDLCQALSEAGATVVNIDEQSRMIEATTPSHEISTIAAMEGVSYVRSFFNYFADHRMAA